MNKTAMQQLLIWTEYRKTVSVNSQVGCWNMFIAKIKEEMIELEKQQIEDAVNYGNRQEVYNGEETLGEGYYLDNFKTDL